MAGSNLNLERDDRQVCSTESANPFGICRPLYATGFQANKGSWDRGMGPAAVSLDLATRRKRSERLAVDQTGTSIRSS